MNDQLRQAFRKLIRVMPVSNIALLLDEKVGVHYLPGMTEDQQKLALEAIECRLAQINALQWARQEALTRREEIVRNNAEIDRRRAEKQQAKRLRRLAAAR